MRFAVKFTTACTFLALTFTDFKMLTKTGVACGSDIIVCLPGKLIPKIRS